AERIGEEDMASLAVLIETMKKASSEKDHGTFLKANQEFHFTIYRAAGSSHLLPVIESFWLKAGPWVRASEQSDLDERRALENQRFHCKVLEALQKRDAAGARRAIVSDLQNAAKLYRAHVEKAAAREAAFAKVH